MLCDKNLQNLLIFAYSFSPKISTATSRKISITQKLLVVESFPTPFSISFVIHYRLVYNIRSHFNQLNTVWNSYIKSLKPILETIKNKLNARMNLIDYVHVFTIFLVSNDKNIIKLKNTQSSTWWNLLLNNTGNISKATNDPDQVIFYFSSCRPKQSWEMAFVQKIEICYSSKKILNIMLLIAFWIIIQGSW